MIAHDGQRQPRAVGDAVEIDLVQAQRQAQIGDVGGVLAAVVGRKLDALVQQTLIAGRVGIVCLSVFVTVQRRFGIAGAALVDEDDVAAVAVG